ncbi:hypothetical protein WUBG_09558 [Wuchereria bancrofti]|uniref:Uncharacterized protein n=1 Tax=Wuchereria bancrofti TaxID=6293 RepID=J9EAY5_WUCBA|nr:hypothetical protein WUBG_09558 [Wuchereria bancrofti]
MNEEDSDEVRIIKPNNETDDRPIASRTRGAERKQKLLQTNTKGTFNKAIIFSLLLQITSANRCNWIAGIPFNLPQK